MKYSELKKEVPFDWNEFLDIPFEKMNYDKMMRGHDRAQLWTTCACGNTCAVIPRDDIFQSPTDFRLRALGMSFTNQINGMYVSWKNADEYPFELFRKDAKEVLEKIERRSGEVLAELKSTMPAEIMRIAKLLEAHGVKVKVEYELPAITILCNGRMMRQYSDSEAGTLIEQYKDAGNFYGVKLEWIAMYFHKKMFQNIL